MRGLRAGFAPSVLLRLFLVAGDRAGHRTDDCGGDSELRRDEKQGKRPDACADRRVALSLPDGIGGALVAMLPASRPGRTVALAAIAGDAAAKRLFP
jgi:hypothetical protein